MPKRKIINESQEETQEEVKEEVENKTEDFIIKSQIKQESKKKAYKVILVTKNKVIYESSPGNGASTVNVWGDKLKPGDTIYLDK